MSLDPLHRKRYFIMESSADFRTYNSAAARKIDRLARNRDHPFGRFVKSSPRANFSRITENFISWLEVCHHRRLQLCAHFILTAADREISCCSWPFDCIRNSFVGNCTSGRNLTFRILIIKDYNIENMSHI